MPYSPFRHRIDRFLRRQEVLAGFPLLMLGAFWLGGEPLLMASAFVLPLIGVLAARRAGQAPPVTAPPEDPGQARTPRARLSAPQEEIAQALESGQIRPYFQPLVCADTGAVTGFEALARWQHPERGLIAPCDFLPDLQAAGLSGRLADITLHHALSALKSWDRAGWQIPAVAVNFSADALRDPGLADTLRQGLGAAGIVPRRLSIEVLENVMADAASDRIVRNVSALARLGCGIALDDFGTSHASIATLHRLTVTRLKIDRTFITGVAKNRGQRRLVSGILSMADCLGLDTVAEGVETPEEHALLAQLGCSHVQGFAIARPMPLADTMDWLHQHTPGPQNTPLWRRIRGEHATRETYRGKSA